jgi:hypothetical protein
VVAEIIRQLVLRGEPAPAARARAPRALSPRPAGERVLACAPSNVAADNIVERLSGAKLSLLRVGHPARLLPSVLAHSMDAAARRADAASVARGIREDMSDILRQLRVRACSLCLFVRVSLSLSLSLSTRPLTRAARSVRSDSTSPP